MNFATLRVKDAIADRFRDKSGVRPDVDTQRPDVRVHVHLTDKMLTLYLDTTGEPLFKRGWREDTVDRARSPSQGLPDPCLTSRYAN